MIESFIRIALSLLLVSACGFSSQARPVSKRIENQIKSNVVPAFQRDDWRSCEKVLSTWVSKFDGEELDQIDSILESHGAPSVGRLLLEARMAKLLSGQPDKKKTQPRELTRSMPELRDQIASIVRDVRESRFFENSLPEMDGMQDYHDGFWDLHVSRNQLQTALRLSRYGQRTSEQALSKKIKGLSEEEQENLQIDFADQARSVESTRDELDEIRTELQVQAIGKAAKLVHDSDDYQERLRAGYVLAFSADPVIETLRGSKSADFDRTLLKNERLLDSVEASVRYARESSADIIEHARLLYLGMHWWMRGRYGQGPEGMGLLKSVAALESNEAQFPLYMPVQPPTPTGVRESNYGYSVPKFDRRHHYIWMYEYRTIQSNLENRQEKQRETSKSIRVTKLDRFY